MGEALQGLASGVKVRGGGQPGSEARVEIRGLKNLSGTNPLYVIDGMITTANRDFNPNDVESVQILKDASAAAIMASGLYELCKYSKNKKEYLTTANIILENLTNHYRAAIGDNQGFILLHSTGSKPANSEVDVPLNYADYYYLEALLRSKGRAM